MKRSLFLVALAGSAVAGATPRLVQARTAPLGAHIVRAVRTRRSGFPGSCAGLRRKARWTSYTAADFIR